MTDREQRRWDAAYGAAMVDQFRYWMNLTHDSDRAVQNMSVEWAITIADLAVLRLRQWNENENDNAGQEVDKDRLPSE